MFNKCQAFQYVCASHPCREIRPSSQGDDGATKTHWFESEQDPPKKEIWPLPLTLKQHPREVPKTGGVEVRAIPKRMKPISYRRLFKSEERVSEPLKKRVVDGKPS